MAFSLARSGIAGYLTDVFPDVFPWSLQHRFRFNSGYAPIQRLPLDIFIDNIFTHLYIEDILSLRCVNKGFFLLTHEPVIWKRFLQRMNIPIPPLRPTFRYSMAVTDYEIEQLVTQAITVDDNWRRPDPTIYNRQVVRSHKKVTDMYLLPGGKYLVASCRDSVHKTYWLTVYMLDHPSGPRALARIQTFAEAFNLEAKFMSFYKGEDGLIISYVRRYFRLPMPPRVRASHFSHRTNVDVPGGFVYETVTVYTSLSMFEFISSPDLEQGSPEYLAILQDAPSPFKELGIVNSNYEISQLSHFELDGAKILAMIVNPAELHFINMEQAEERVTLTFKPHYAHPDKPHRLRAFRIYPGQKDMIVIRSVSPLPGQEVHLVEWYDLPQAFGVLRVAAKARYSLHGKRVRKFHISDYGIPGKDKLGPDHPTLRHTLGPPPPVSIYLELERPNGVEHHAIYPRQERVSPAAPGPARYRYVYDHDSYQMSTHICAPNRACVLPGSYRAMLYVVDGEDRTDHPKIMNLRRYIHPKNSGVDYQPDPNPDDEPEPVLRRKNRLAIPKTGVYKSFETSTFLNEINKLGGVSAIAWDESTGRTCIAPEKMEEIHILDCAHMVKPDKRFDEWKRKQKFLFGYP